MELEKATIEQLNARLESLKLEAEKAREGKLKGLPGELKLSGVETVDDLINALAQYASPRMKGRLKGAASTPAKRGRKPGRPAGAKAAKKPTKKAKSGGKSLRGGPALKKWVDGPLKAGTSVKAIVAAIQEAGFTGTAEELTAKVEARRK